MSDTTLLGPWVRRFLMEYLIGERNLAVNTQRSYRDTLRQLLPLIARSAHKRIDLLGVEDLSADRIRRFLRDLEESNGRSIATRNQRLAAIHSLAQFISLHSPEHVQWCGEIRAIVMKKGPRVSMRDHGRHRRLRPPDSQRHDRGSMGLPPCLRRRCRR